MTHPSIGSPPRAPRRAGARRWIGVLAVTSIYLVPFFSLDGAIEIFLKLGDIKGESTNENHKDEIEIISWGWGVSQDSGGTIGQFRERTAKDIRALVLTKRTDKSTAAIFLNTLTGKHVDEATLTVSQSGREGFLEFLKIELKDVFVTSYEVTGDDLNDPIETFGLSFDSIQTTYTLFGNDGEERGTSEVFWTLSTDTGGGSSDGGGGGGGSGPPPNNPPTISLIPDQTIDEDGSFVVNFTVSDPETPAGSLTLGRSSSNQVLLPLANIVFGGSGSSRSATLTPAPNQNGTSSVLITVSDGSRTDSESFLLTVNAINDPPSLPQIGAQVAQADEPLDLAVTVTDLDSNLDTLTLTGTANPPGLLAGITDTTQSGNIRTLRLVPAPGATGTTTVTLTATDDAQPVPGQTQTSFSLTINPGPGGGPTAIFLNGLDSTTPVPVDENTPSGTDLGLFETVGDPGVQYGFTLLDDAGGRFAIGGPGQQHLVAADRSLLDFEETSSLSIVVQATDLGDPLRTRTESFLIELQNVNEAPAITLPPDFGTTAPGTAHRLEGILIDDPDSGPADIVATFTVGDGILTLDDSGPLAGKTVGNASNSVTVTAPVADLRTALATSFGLVYRSDPTFTGTETLTVTTDDAGNTGLGGTQSDLAAATLAVQLTSWELWRRANFTATELLDANISSFTADPDHDGLSNGGEYGVDGAPKDFHSGPDRIEVVYVESGAGSYPALQFVRRVSDPDFTTEVQLATDLLNWVGGPAYTAQESLLPLSTDFDRPLIRTLFPVSANPKQFIRLRFALDTP